MPIPELGDKADRASSGNTVAVVVPLLNEADALPQLLHSLRQCAADELVLVDGGSSDRTPEILQQSGLRWLSSQRGRGAQMNAGARACESKIILFLHADTEIGSSHIELLRGLSLNSDHVGGRFDVRLSGIHPALRMIEFFMNLRSRVSKMSTGDQGMFVRRDVFEAMRGFAEIPLMEDIEFSRRLKRQGSIACLREKVRTSSRRWEEYGIARTVLLMWRLRLLYWLGTPVEKLATLYREAR